MDTQAAVHGITITVDDTELTIADVTKPLWFGDYHKGKLAIYEATSVPSIIPACISIVSVYTDPAGLDFVMSSHYEPDVPLHEICAHIIAQAIITYHKVKAGVPVSTYVPGPDTLQ